MRKRWLAKTLLLISLWYVSDISIKLYSYQFVRQWGWGVSRGSLFGEARGERALVIKPINSEIDDPDFEKVYILPIDYQLKGASKWKELRRRFISPFASAQVNLRQPFNFTEPVGIALTGKKGYLDLKISLYFKGELISHCYSIDILEKVEGNIINIYVGNRWYPLLLCNNKVPKPVEGVFNVMDANLPGNYVLFVNDRKIAEISYSLEENKITIVKDGREYTLEGITQELLFPQENS